MIREERLLKVLRAPHVSEKASTAMEKAIPSFSKLRKTRLKQKSKLLYRNCLKSKLKVLTLCWLKAKLNATVSVSVVVATGKSLRHAERRPKFGLH